MYYLMEKARRRNNKGFTLVELLVVIVVLAVLAAIVLPKFMNSSKRSKESALRSDLKLLRNAVDLFRTDTGLYPAQLSDLAAAAKPANGLNTDGTTATINAADWHGPYLQEVPSDPVTGAKDWTYSTTSGSVGDLHAGSSDKGLDGTVYSTW